MNKAIGGYFNLETNRFPNGYIHTKGIHLNSGRNALEYILKSIPVVQRLYIPYYTCDVVLEPINKLGISYDYYRINEHLELDDEIHLDKDEYLLATNYFGIKDAYIKILAKRYGERLIVDNAQALFAEPLKGIKTVYSPRKFVGIPDGGISYMNNGLDITDLDQDISYSRCSHLLKRIDLGAEAGYDDFKRNSHKLINQPVKLMSNLTRCLLQSINWEFVNEQRLKNFIQLHDTLSSINQLDIPPLDTFACPMVYPLYTTDSTLKRRLIENKIFVATYWPNVLEWCKDDMLEHELASKLIAIPIDQRYNNIDMNRIINMIINGTNCFI